MLGKYKHYKGGVYEVTGMAYDPETYQTVVMYKNEDGVTFIRTVENFFEFVDDNEGTLRPRFQYVPEDEPVEPEGLDMSKPHKGKIEGWFKVPCDLGLGYTVAGTPYGHPDFKPISGIRTSYVVKRSGNEIETLNSRYTLGEPDRSFVDDGE